VCSEAKDDVLEADEIPPLTCVPRSEDDVLEDPLMQVNLSIVAIATLPAKVDLRKKEHLEVFDQGNIGSCTANATAAAFHYCLHKEHLQEFIPARLFIYFNGRNLDHGVGHSGESITSAIKSVLKYGVCPEKMWPYVKNHVDTKPPSKCYSEGLHHRATSAHHVGTHLDDIKKCLSMGFPVVFGFWVYKSFMHAKDSGKMPMPSHGEQVLGGHAVCAVGYDDSKHVLIVRNSWGDHWGDHGFFYMPYKFVTTKGVFDAHCIRWVKDFNHHHHHHHHHHKQKRGSNSDDDCHLSKRPRHQK